MYVNVKELIFHCHFDGQLLIGFGKLTLGTAIGFNAFELPTESAS